MASCLRYSSARRGRQEGHTAPVGSVAVAAAAAVEATAVLAALVVLVLVLVEIGGFLVSGFVVAAVVVGVLVVEAIDLEGASGVLQPIHSCVFLANFMSPPIVGAATAMERVCAPVSSCDAFFSPRMGVKIRSSGFVS